MSVCLLCLLPPHRLILKKLLELVILQVENVVTALRGKSGNLVDIGSGDGRIVLGEGV